MTSFMHAAYVITLRASNCSATGQELQSEEAASGRGLRPESGLCFRKCQATWPLNCCFRLDTQCLAAPISLAERIMPEL